MGFEALHAAWSCVQRTAPRQNYSNNWFRLSQKGAKLWRVPGGTSSGRKELSAKPDQKIAMINNTAVSSITTAVSSPLKNVGFVFMWLSLMN